MTFILGSKCKDGVVLVADRKVSFPETGNLRYRTKLFVGNPIVVGTAGSISGLDILRNNFIKVASNLDKSVNADSLKQRLENIANNINKEFKEVKNQGHDLLIAMRTNDKGATLHRFYPGGSLDPVEDYEAIGSGEPYGSVFLKLLWGRERTMQEVAELGFFIIKYIEDLKLNDSVGVGDQDPQICFIPDYGEINEAGNIELNRFRTSSLNRLNRYNNYIVEGYESGPAKQSLESFLQEIKPFDIEVFTEIYSWQGEHIPFVKFNDDYTEFDFVRIKGWEKIREKYEDSIKEFDAAVDNLSRIGLLRRVRPTKKIGYKFDHYIITPLSVRFMEFNDVIASGKNKQS